MNIRAINYCVHEADMGYRDGLFSSMQILVGDQDSEDPEEWVALRKHGQSGGNCRQWRLKPEDYIRLI